MRAYDLTTGAMGPALIKIVAGSAPTPRPKRWPRWLLAMAIALAVALAGGKVASGDEIRFDNWTLDVFDFEIDVCAGDDRCGSCEAIVQASADENAVNDRRHAVGNRANLEFDLGRERYKVAAVIRGYRRNSDEETVRLRWCLTEPLEPKKTMSVTRR